MSKSGTGATGIAAIGIAHDTGIAGTTTAQGSISTSGRATVTATGGIITIGGIGSTDNCRLFDSVVMTVS